MHISSDSLQARLLTVTILFLASACVINRAQETNPGVQDDDEEHGAPAQDGIDKAVPQAKSVKAKAPVTNAAVKAPAAAAKAPVAVAKAPASAAKAPVATAAKAPVATAAKAPVATAVKATVAKNPTVTLVAKVSSSSAKPAAKPSPAAAAKTAAAVIAPPAPKTALHSERVVRYVNAEVLNVRSSPRSDAPVVAKVTRGSMFSVGMQGDWAQLGDHQYVQSKYLIRSQPAVRGSVAMRK